MPAMLSDRISAAVEGGQTLDSVRARHAAKKATESATEDFQRFVRVYGPSGCICDLPSWRLGRRCVLHGERLEALRRITAWNRGRTYLELMLQKLPRELVLSTIEHLAYGSLPTVYLEDESSLYKIAKDIIGQSSVAEAYLPVARQAILNVCTIQLNVAFARKDGEKVATMPTIDIPVRKLIRNIQLEIDLDTTSNGCFYPITLYNMTGGLSSLLSQLPQLKTISLMLVICVDGNSNAADIDNGNFLGRACHKGFSGKSTFREETIRLIEAAKATSTAHNTSIQLRYKVNGGGMAVERKSVEFGDLSATKIMQEADAGPLKPY